MCGTHVIVFLSCGHLEDGTTRVLFCPGPICTQETIYHEVDRFCISCLFDHFSARNLKAMGGRKLQDLLESEAESIISNDETSGVEDIESPNNIMEFSEPLTYEDGVWLKSIEHDIYTAILTWLLTPTIDEDSLSPLPDPTYDDLLMYLQIRKAMLAQMLRKSEETITSQVRASASLSTILTPASASEESSCSICKTDFDDDEIVEFPVELPCRHVFGSRCLERWAGTWKPDTEFVVSCPMCRRVFMLLPRDEEPVTPQWMRVLREIWNL